MQQLQQALTRLPPNEWQAAKGETETEAENVKKGPLMRKTSHLASSEVSSVFAIDGDFAFLVAEFPFAIDVDSVFLVARFHTPSEL